MQYVHAVWFVWDTMETLMFSYFVVKILFHKRLYLIVTHLYIALCSAADFSQLQVTPLSRIYCQGTVTGGQKRVRMRYRKKFKTFNKN